MDYTYFETWDPVHARFLVKLRKDDQWELSPTPAIYCTDGRVYDQQNAIYYEPPTAEEISNRFWEPKEGRWVIKKKRKNMKREEIKSLVENNDRTTKCDISEQTHNCACIEIKGDYI